MATKKPAEKPTDPMIGKYFHIMQTEEDGCETVKNQGRIEASPATNVYLVQFFEWFFGDPSNQELKTLDELVNGHFRFYDSSEDMKYMWETYRKGANDAHYDHEKGAKAS